MLKWGKVKGADGYEIYRSTGAKNTYKKVCFVKGTSFTNTQAVKGTTYYYKVRAVNKEKTNANSAFSEYCSVKSK